MSARRDFLKIMASGATAGFPALVPSSALGKDGYVAPSERIVMGCIGVGRQGGQKAERKRLMAIDKHTVAVLDGSSATFTDRTVIGVLICVANAAGSGAGGSVTTAVAFAEPLPASYTAVVQPNQDAVAYLSGKTTAGFNVVMNPRLAANTLAAGAFDVILYA